MDSFKSVGMAGLKTVPESIIEAYFADSQSLDVAVLTY